MPAVRRARRNGDGDPDRWTEQVGASGSRRGTNDGNPWREPRNYDPVLFGRLWRRDGSIEARRRYRAARGGAVGGHAIEKWNDPAYDATLWDDCISRKLAQAGIRPDQVRVLWHKAADQFTTLPNGAPLPAYPATGSDYDAFFANLTTIAGRVRAKFPSVQAVYVSSRSYGGFADTPARGEPLSHEEGHALNSWLARNREVQGVWYGWGPYLWAPDCAAGVQNVGGVCYVRSDYVSDGVHPSASGQANSASEVTDPTKSADVMKVRARFLSPSRRFGPAGTAAAAC